MGILFPEQRLRDIILKKYLDPSVDLRPNYTNTKRHSWITFRLGEFI
jgi:hypothetical protein